MGWSGTVHTGIGRAVVVVEAGAKLVVGVIVGAQVGERSSLTRGWLTVVVAWRRG